MILFLLFFQTLCYSQRGTVPVMAKNTGKSKILYENSFALIIGNSNYLDPNWDDLPGVKKDLEIVKGILEIHGFKVIPKMDLNETELEEVIEEFIFNYGQGKNDRLIIYYAGHGETTISHDQKEGWLVPIDAPKMDVQDLTSISEFKNKGFRINNIRQYEVDINSKHVLFLFDSCFSGSVFRGGSKPPKNIEQATENPVRHYMTSGTESQVVPDKSIYREELVNALSTAIADADKDGYLSFTELYNYLRKSVTDRSSGSQTPMMGYSKLPQFRKGNFVFKLPENISDTQNIGFKVYELEISNKPGNSSIVYDNNLEGQLYLNNKFVRSARKNKRYVFENLPSGKHVLEVRSENDSIIKNLEISELEPLFIKSVNSGKTKLRDLNRDSLGLTEDYKKHHKYLDDYKKRVESLDKIKSQNPRAEEIKNNHILIDTTIPTELGEVYISFGTSQNDSLSARQEVSPKLIYGLAKVLNNANEILYGLRKPLIESIHIISTTNGKHSKSSNHFSGEALDISRINLEHIFRYSNHLGHALANLLEIDELNSFKSDVNYSDALIYQILAIQSGIQKFNGRRENFGPLLSTKFYRETSKNDYSYHIRHEDHIHFSVR